MEGENFKSIYAMVAAKMNVSVQYVYLIEKGKRNTNTRLAKKVKEAIKIGLKAKETLDNKLKNLIADDAN